MDDGEKWKGKMAKWTFWPLGGAALMVFFFFALARAGPEASHHGVKTTYINLSEREARARKLFEKALKSKDLKKREQPTLRFSSFGPATSAPTTTLETPTRGKKGSRRPSRATRLPLP